MNIPEFKNTEESITFGKKYKGNFEVINQLKKNYAILRSQAKELMKQNKPDEALLIISGQGQFSREAFEEAENCSVIFKIIYHVCNIYHIIGKILLYIGYAFVYFFMGAGMIICGVMGFGFAIICILFMLKAIWIAIFIL
jgi:hypothetical protein